MTCKNISLSGINIATKFIKNKVLENIYKVIDSFCGYVNIDLDNFL